MIVLPNVKTWLLIVVCKWKLKFWKQIWSRLKILSKMSANMCEVIYDIFLHLSCSLDENAFLSFTSPVNPPFLRFYWSSVLSKAGKPFQLLLCRDSYLKFERFTSFMKVRLKQKLLLPGFLWFVFMGFRFCLTCLSRRSLEVTQLSGEFIQLQILRSVWRYRGENQPPPNPLRKHRWLCF